MQHTSPRCCSALVRQVSPWHICGTRSCAAGHQLVTCCASCIARTATPRERRPELLLAGRYMTRMRGRSPGCVLIALPVCLVDVRNLRHLQCPTSCRVTVFDQSRGGQCGLVKHAGSLRGRVPSAQAGGGRLTNGSSGKKHMKSCQYTHSAAVQPHSLCTQPDLHVVEASSNFQCPPGLGSVSSEQIESSTCAQSWAEVCVTLNAPPLACSRWSAILSSMLLRTGKQCTFDTVSAGLHCSLRMSRQMLPLLLMLGWYTFVEKLTCKCDMMSAWSRRLEYCFASNCTVTPTQGC